MAEIVPHPAKPSRPPGAIPIAGRVYPGSGQLLSARIEDWARALPPWRVEQGLLLFDIADAFRIRDRRLLGVLRALGWWIRYPGPHEPMAIRFYPPWVEQHGHAGPWPY